MTDLAKLKFDEQGLIPAVARDASTGETLMLAYMNRESLQITLQKKKACFYSRKRRALWTKGETSGNVLDVLSIRADCDFDSLLLDVIPRGPACHTGAKSCFFNPILEGENAFSLEYLYEVINRRKSAPKEGSYTTYLFEKGLDKILKKVGEEAAEVIIGAKNSKEETVYEISDLVYHLLVLMAEKEIPLEAILRELQSRHGKEQ